MKFAAIDIGSNAVRLIFINVYQTKKGVQYVKDAMYRVALRLGEESFNLGCFSKIKTEEIISTMKAFKHLINVHQPIQVMACATSAMRDASNSKDIVEKVYKKTGIKIDIISGQREAELVLSNHVEVLDMQKHTNYLYIDVGGGSTELVLLSNGKTIDKESFNIGTLRMNLGKVKPKQWEKLNEFLNSINSRYKNIQGIGVGGNINTIQKIYASKNGVVSQQHLKNAIKEMELLNTEERIIKYNFKPDRADVIIPASKIFLYVMEQGNIASLLVPKVGLGDGMVHYMYEKYKTN